MRRALRRNLPRFVLLIAFISMGTAVGAYIVSQQRFRFPLIEEPPMRLAMELPTAQAVTPGQGQTVRVSGVQVAEVGEVTLEDGHARVELLIHPDFKGLVTDEATALLRPKTSLKDMFLELDPGRGRPLRDGEVLPLGSALPDVHPDEILRMLDADTRDYLQLLVAGAGRGLEGRGRDLREAFRLFEPTHRDLARLNGLVSERRQNLRRLVHSLRLLSEELGGREDELARLVRSAARVFRSYAAEDREISEAVHELPAALTQTTRTLAEVERFARVLGPASERLRPAVRALGRSQEEFRGLAREGEPIVRERVRPLVRDTRPLARELGPAARDLSASTPELTRVLGVFNRFFNMAAYNPDGPEPPSVPTRQEGYLFWFAWLTHQSANIFSTADAHGPFRPSLVAVSCQTARSLAQTRPEAEFLLNLTPILTNPEACGE